VGAAAGAATQAKTNSTALAASQFVLRPRAALSIVGPIVALLPPVFGVFSLLLFARLDRMPFIELVQKRNTGLACLRE
jgi:hypothetical protein